MAFAYPAHQGVFVPSFDATGKLIVAFSRNPKDFALPKYTTITPVKKVSGYYMRITPEQAARVVNTNLYDMGWPEGADAPQENWGTESFSFFQYATRRYSTGFSLGTLTVDQAAWDIVASHAAMVAQRMMTARAVLAWNTILLVDGSYATGQTDTATNWGGGFLDAGTPTSPKLKIALNKIARTIQKATLGVVQPKDLMFVSDPVVFSKIGEGQEVHAYLKESPYALAEVRGDGGDNQNAAWNLPNQMYGFKFVCEDAVRVSSAKGATLASDYIVGGNDAVVVARPGGITSQEGAPSFSSVHFFMQEEMTVETKDDPDNRRMKGRITENYDVEMVAPASAVRIKNALS